MGLLLGRSEVDRELGRTWALADDVRGSAIFSDCGNYRPYLSRRWAQGDMIMWLCMNPSSATDIVDDDTSRKLTRHSRRFGFGGLFLLNIMDYRETDPDRLPEGIEQSPINQRLIMKCARLSAAHILAYGGLQKKTVWREYAAQAVETCGDRDFQCTVRNIDGSPRHPRMFSANPALIPFN